jgi:hypothetical protein
MICRTIAEVLAAADADSIGEAPLTQAQADRVAAILAPTRQTGNDIADALVQTAREPSTP